jgi:hypothetical protein
MHEPKRFEFWLHGQIEAVVGQLEMWELRLDWCRFRAQRELTLKDIAALSRTLDTHAINFNFGEAGWAGSDVTPGDPMQLGYVEVKFSEAGARALRARFEMLSKT